MKTSKEIRQSFLDFFAQRGHTIVRSAPVVPENDPTLLFTNAGMNQFKDVFLGTGTRPYKRAADTQKCIRVSGKHNDLEEVGVDTYHHTFFEMLGNWSFGDYFKKEAIRWAWEYLTEVAGLDPDRLWVTVFGGDERLGLEPDLEAKEYWLTQTPIPEERVLFFGTKDNFWEMGDVGPCGPCTEIHYDRGPEACDMKDVPGHVCGVNGECGRFIEVWNLVFIQFNRDESGRLTPLPAKHVDTGMGLERLVAIVQGKLSNYDTDLFTPIFERLHELTGLEYGTDHDVDVAFRVAADHARALSVAIADGVLPGNVGRGYVLRRLLRRAARYGRQFLGLDRPFMGELAEVVAGIYRDVFPEIAQRLPHIKIVLESEEKAFARTLDKGLRMFEKAVANLGEGDVLDGETAFDLYATYGFPKDLVELMLRERGLGLDQEGWERAQKRHEEVSDSGKRTFVEFDASQLEGLPETRFVGYPHDNENFLETQAKLLKVLPGPRLVLDRTPFYSEAGGQVSDTGWIEGERFRFRVKDVKKVGAYYVHEGELVETRGEGDVPETVVARVDRERRLSIMANHTATHLLHWALRKVLGEHATQQGSYVGPDRLRFDFTHPKKLTDEEIREIERLVNERIYEDHEVRTDIMSLEEARAAGATALFGEKYGDVVRVVSIGDFSRELCGGTHVLRTGWIGPFVIVEESSLAAGVRRIQAVTRGEAVRFIRSRLDLVEGLARSENVKVEELPDRMGKLHEEIKRLKKEMKSRSAVDLKTLRDKLLSEATEVGGVKIVTAHVPALDRKGAAELADMLRGGSSPVAGLVAVPDGKGGLALIAFRSKELDSIHAGNVLREAAAVAGGRGGGRPDFAQGGAKDASKVEDVLRRASELISSSLN